MAEPMRVDLVSPERVLFSGEATEVITRTVGGGEIAFLAGHAPFLATLADSHTRIKLVSGETIDVAVHGGFVEVSNNTVSILTDEADLGEDISLAGAEAERERAEERLRHEHDAEAAAALSRANARVSAASGS